MSYEDDNNFGKQRRNLILISAPLLTKNYLDIDYSTFDLFGSGITIGNTDGINIILWILWTYFLIRYFTLFFEAGDKHGKDWFYIGKRNISSYCEKKCYEKIKNAKGVTITNNNKMWHTNCVIKTNNPNKEYTYKISKIKILYILFLSLISNTFKRHYFFEYYFPIIFALLPLLTLIK